MVDPKLLDLLVCPETKQPLRVADDAVLDALNRGIEAGSVSTRAGERVTESVREGLLREDGRFLYPVRDDIPVMLIDEAIPVETSEPTSR